MTNHDVHMFTRFRNMIKGMNETLQPFGSELPLVYYALERDLSFSPPMYTLEKYYKDEPTDYYTTAHEVIKTSNFGILATTLLTEYDYELSKLLFGM